MTIYKKKSIMLLSKKKDVLPLQEKQEAFVANCKTVLRRRLSGNKLIAYKERLSLTTIQKEVLIGTLLGDASISCRLGKPVYSVKFEQKHTQIDYINHLYEVFEPFVGTSPQMRTIINDYHKTPGQSCWFRTYSHISLKYYYDIFYVVNDVNRRVKRVPKTIAKLLTPRALAYWYMDDGTAAFDKRNIGSFVLNTQGFNHADHKRLVLALKIKFGIKATIFKDKTYFRLRIASESKAIFLSLIREHIVPSFIYKLGRVL
uniref:Putative site-specific DNA endonuclease n=1 Tax=Tupiella akineta TaxID=160070 RepID=Q6UVW3_TUPAK|nr:putative site-specific DNA endonuclease [Tupiella akineta]AAQ18710.1 putative site-specific DNA endonuclease [Tupiella akineta]